MPAGQALDKGTLRPRERKPLPARPSPLPGIEKGLPSLPVGYDNSTGGGGASTALPLHKLPRDGLRPGPEHRDAVIMSGPRRVRSQRAVIEGTPAVAAARTAATVSRKPVGATYDLALEPEMHPVQRNVDGPGIAGLGYDPSKLFEAGPEAALPAPQSRARKPFVHEVPHAAATAGSVANGDASYARMRERYRIWEEDRRGREPEGVARSGVSSRGSSASSSSSVSSAFGKIKEKLSPMLKKLVSPNPPSTGGKAKAAAALQAQREQEAFLRQQHVPGVVEGIRPSDHRPIDQRTPKRVPSVDGKRPHHRMLYHDNQPQQPQIHPSRRDTAWGGSDGFLAAATAAQAEPVHDRAPSPPSPVALNAYPARCSPVSPIEEPHSRWLTEPSRNIRKRASSESRSVCPSLVSDDTCDGSPHIPHVKGATNDHIIKKQIAKVFARRSSIDEWDFKCRGKQRSLSPGLDEPQVDLSTLVGPSGVQREESILRHSHPRRASLAIGSTHRARPRRDIPASIMPFGAGGSNGPQDAPGQCSVCTRVLANSNDATCRTCMQNQGVAAWIDTYAPPSPYGKKPRAPSSIYSPYRPSSQYTVAGNPFADELDIPPVPAVPAQFTGTLHPLHPQHSPRQWTNEHGEVRLSEDYRHWDDILRSKRESEASHVNRRGY